MPDTQMLIRFLKWTAVGALGIAVKLATLGLAREVLGAHYLAATAAAVEAAILHNFCWHQCWTWRNRSGGLRRLDVALRLFRFQASTGLLAFPANIALMRILVEGAGLHYLLANLICVPLVGIINFLVAEFLIFLPLRAGPISTLSLVESSSMASKVLITSSTHRGTVPRT